MGILMQAFYWDCPNDETQQSWWQFLQSKMASLSQQGFSAIWLPPVSKAYPVAWRGKNDANAPLNTATNSTGYGQFWAPPRGYTVYAPQW